MVDVTKKPLKAVCTMETWIMNTIVFYIKISFHFHEVVSTFYGKKELNEGYQ